MFLISYSLHGKRNEYGLILYSYYSLLVIVYMVSAMSIPLLVFPLCARTMAGVVLYPSPFTLTDGVFTVGG